MIPLAALTVATVSTAPPLENPPPRPVPATAQASSDAVAFVGLTMGDGDGPPVEIGVWSAVTPSGGRRPLVVLSHGNGGDFRSHEATARALAAAGFVVAALTHTGDNWRDQSRATDLPLRTRQLHRLIDFMTGEWDGRDGVDPDRIGAFGFSAGGFTVLTAAGGEPDLLRIADHCRARPDFFDCRLMAAHAVGAGSAPTGPRPVWTRDARLKAVVVAAPALGFAFAPDGLTDVTLPVQLWQAEGDQILPGPFYVEPVRDALPRPPEHHLAQGAGHFDFLPPCSPRLAENAPMICAPTPGFDRAAFHQTFNREMARFFRETL